MLRRLTGATGGSRVKVRFGASGKLARRPEFHEHWPQPVGTGEALREMSFVLQGLPTSGRVDSRTLAGLPFDHLALADLEGGVVLMRVKAMPAAGFPLLVAAALPSGDLATEVAWTVLDGLSRMAFTIEQLDRAGRGHGIAASIEEAEAECNRGLAVLGMRDDDAHGGGDAVDEPDAAVEQCAAELQRLHDAGAWRTPGRTPVVGTVAGTQLLAIHRFLRNAVVDPPGSRIVVGPGVQVASAGEGGFAALMDSIATWATTLADDDGELEGRLSGISGRIS